MSSGRKRRTGPSSVKMREAPEQVHPGHGDVVRDADEPDVAAGARGVDRCIIDSWVPTAASTTDRAPSPFVSSLIAATPPSPRSSTTSVAPYSRAKALW